MYHILIWIRNTRAWTLMKGILVMIVFIFIATLLNLDSILFLVSKGINAILVATAVIFSAGAKEGSGTAWRKKFLLRCYRLIWKKMQRNVSAIRPSTSW